MRPRSGANELDELKYDGCGRRGGHRLRRHGPADAQLMTRGYREIVGGRSLFSGLDIALIPGIKLGCRPHGSRQKHTTARAGRRNRPDAGSVGGDGLVTVMFEARAGALDQTRPWKGALPQRRHRDVSRPLFARSGVGQTILISTGATRFADERPIRRRQARVRHRQPDAESRDLLLLDEPTNDLDIPAWKC